MLAYLHNLSIETATTEEEAAEGLDAVLETQDMEVEGDTGGEGEKVGGGTQQARKPLSSSLRMQIRAALRSLMTVMDSTS